MEKKRYFLGFLASLFVIFLTGHALAAGYTCPDSKRYTECNTGYYLNDSDVGNACLLCSSADNNTSTQDCSANASITNGTRVSSGTQTCAGKFTGGTGGTTVGTGTCTGCSEWGACNYTSYVCNCNSGYHASGTGATCTCEPDTTSVTCSAGYYIAKGATACSTECPANKWCEGGTFTISSAGAADNIGISGSCPTNYTSPQKSTSYTACTTSCTVPCSGDESCSYSNATCTYNTTKTYTGTKSCQNAACSTQSACSASGTCPVNGFNCNTGYKKDGNTCKAEVYTITYDLDGGTQASSDVPASYTYGVGATISGTPTRSGYAFAGWCTDAAKTSCFSTIAISKTDFGNKTIYAKWSASNYTINYNLNGGTQASSGVPTSYTYGVGATINGIPTLQGHTFAGWCKDSTLASCAMTQTISATDTGNKIFSAKWTPNTYTITYNLDGGTPATSGVPESYTYGVGATINGAPTKTGNTFAGWCTDANKTTCAPTQIISAADTGNKTFYAKWTINDYTITYKNGGGNGSDQTQQVTYNAKFTTKAGNIFTKPGFTFKSWGGSYPNPNSQYTYTTAGNTTLTAQWNACSANTGGAGTCDCGATQYPNGSGCANCSVSCSGVSGFTLGNYNVCNSQTDDVCYRNCTQTDIPNSANVGGTVTKGGTNTCYAQSCASGYFVSGKGCAKLPEGGKLCEDGTSLCCNTGYTKSGDGLNCNPNKYTVTYSCGEGGGSKPANGTATYNAAFTPASNTCTRADWQFNGWAVSGTTDTKSAGASFTWQYLENKTFTAKWIQTAGNCTTGEYYDEANTKCQTCPSGYTSDLGATSQSQCYKECNTAACTKKCPENSYTCTVDATAKVSGIQYYGQSTCIAGSDNACPITVLSCKGDYYLDSATETCKLCSSLASGYTSNDDNSGGPSACWKMCSVDKCETGGRAECPTDRATECFYAEMTINGYQPWGGECVPYEDITMCEIVRMTCRPEYEGSDCHPKTFAITLNVNGGSGSNTTIYQKYTVGWFSDEGANTAISKAPIPTRENWSFLGYYTAATGGDMVIDANGTLPANTKYTTNGTVLYAQWSQLVEECQAGMKYDGTKHVTCPAGSYCPGVGNSPIGTAGCVRTCPADTKGGTVTSTAGSSDVTACQTTRQNVELEDKTGYANQTCNYLSESAGYAAACEIKITACKPGNYRQSESAITCASCEVGAYCPGQELNKYLCKDLSGANSTTTTKGTNSDAASACYNTCASVGITNGVRNPDSTEVYFSGSAIPACTYTTQCNTGYDVSGDACVAHVYTITLNHNGGQSSTNAIYLKYGDGWYSAKAATTNTKITSVAKPSFAGKTFSGYVSGGVVVADANGRLTDNLTVFHDDVTITANWDQNPSITCAPGTYYKGIGTTCTDCPAGSYCVGGTAIQDSGNRVGIATCTSLNGTYTTANGMTTTISSAPKSESAAACYATNLAYTSPTNHGSGTQTCYYSAGSYSAACTDIEIRACVKGYWRENTDAEDCTEAGMGYYSPENDISRTECPGLNEGKGVSTESTTSEKVTQCLLGNIWYEPTNSHGGGRRSCRHASKDQAGLIPDLSQGYSHNCAALAIKVCDAGYYDDGKTMNSEGIRICVPVEKNYYSPEQSFYESEATQPNEEDAPGSSTKRMECPDSGLTDTTTAAYNTACYKVCPVKTIENGTTTANPATVKYTGTQYPACTYVATCDAGFTSATGDTPTENPECGKCRAGYFCPDDGSGPTQCPSEYPKSDSGANNQKQCYRECALSENAATMSGKDYLGGSTCAIATCKAGSYLQNGACVTCPAGQICTGGTEGPEECPADHYCPSGSDEPKACPPEFPNSAAGTTAESGCYRACAVGDVDNATSVSGTVSKGGVNKCVATACAAGTYLEDGECVQCPAGKVCNGGTDKPAECPEGSYCEGGTDTPTQCPASHPKSHLNTTTISGCYQECTEYQLNGGTAIPKAPTASYPAVCEYTGKSDTGNPCEIVGDKCVETRCNSDYELINGRCRPCDRENALSYKPQGNCMVASCVTGYHPNGQKCDENVRECPAPNATLAQQTWDFSKNAFSTCTIVECESGYHIASNACVLDERECVVENGIGTQEWNSASNSWGECIATQCDPGYTNDPYETNERTKQCGQCKNKFSVLGEQAASTYIQGCEIASCMYQGELYNLENNECVPICSIEQREDETGTMKWDPSRKKCVRTCKEGYTSW